MHTEQVLLKPWNIWKTEEEEETTRKAQKTLRLLAITSPRDGQTPLKKVFVEGYATDPFPTEIRPCLHEGTQHHRKITLGDCGDDDGRLTYRN